MDKLLRKIADYIEDPDIAEPMVLARKIIGIIAANPWEAPREWNQFFEENIKREQKFEWINTQFTIRGVEALNRVRLEDLKNIAASNLGMKLLEKGHIDIASRNEFNTDETVYTLSIRIPKKS